MNNQLKPSYFSRANDRFIYNFPPDDKPNPRQQLEKSLVEKGKDENTKNQAEKKAVDKQMVNDLVKKSNRCIISISSLFPWNIFPNTIDVEESRVTFIFRQFMSSRSHSVDIKDISNVFIESSLFFATLQIVSRTYIKNKIKINFLHKEKAERVKMIIEGLRTFANNDIDTSIYEVDELVSKLAELETNRPLSSVGNSEVIYPYLSSK